MFDTFLSDLLLLLLIAIILCCLICSLLYDMYFLSGAGYLLLFEECQSAQQHVENIKKGNLLSGAI